MSGCCLDYCVDFTFLPLPCNLHGWQSESARDARDSMHHAKWAGNLSSNEREDKKGFWIVNYVPSTGVDRLAKILVFINFIAAFFCSFAVPLRSLYFSSRLLSKRKHWRARSKRSLKWRLNAPAQALADVRAALRRQRQRQQRAC